MLNLLFAVSCCRQIFLALGHCRASFPAVDSARELMTGVPYFRLIVLTAGTLLPFFWMVVILGHCRQRDFERIFFFLCLALVFFFGSSLLALNAQLYYTTIPAPLALFAWTVQC